MAIGLTDDKHYKAIADAIRRNTNGEVSQSGKLTPAEMPNAIVGVGQSGYETGFEQGHERGQSSGYDKGYSEGFKAGKSEGGGGDTEAAYQEGFAAGVEQGKQAEYDRFWDSFQQNGEKQNYNTAFGGYGWTEESLKPKYLIKPVETKQDNNFVLYMFRELGRGSSSANTLFDMTEVCKKVDFSECLSLYGVFYGSRAKNITINAPKATTAQELFRQGNNGSNENITLTISRNCKNYTNAFYYNGMKGFMVTEGSEIAASINLQWSSKLSAESMKSIIKALVDYSGDTDNEYKHTAKFAEEAWATLEADSAAPDGITWKEYVRDVKCWNI